MPVSFRAGITTAAMKARQSGASNLRLFPSPADIEAQHKRGRPLDPAETEQFAGCGAAAQKLLHPTPKLADLAVFRNDGAFDSHRDVLEPISVAVFSLEVEWPMPKLDLPAGPVERFAYSIEEVTKVTGLGRSYIYEEIRDGRLRIRKAGRRLLVLPDDLKAWLASLPAK